MAQLLRSPRHLFGIFLFAWSLFLLPPPAMAQVAFSEIMYHPVEEPAFNADGSAVMDLYEDVHEFVELHNAGPSAVSLAGWELSGGIRYRFPASTVLLPDAYLVVAKDPARLAAVAAYGLRVEDVLGPFEGQLSNERETLRLLDGARQVVEVVAYAAEFPWAVSADALGAADDFTGLRALDYQYRGRSLERVSFTHSATDPANWLASPLPGNPSPGRPNAVSLPVPRPVVVAIGVSQVSNESPIIRSNQTVAVRARFSGPQSLSGVQLEWFVDDINQTNELRTVADMTAEGPAEAGRFIATIPGQLDRSVVRYRFLAHRGAGPEVVSPRVDDPYRWHAYFVNPVRSSSRPVYDFFISSKSLTTLSTNISQSPRRITSPDPPGRPRASWNAAEPGLVVCSNVVYDMRAHYHGSRYNRNPGANSWQWRFPRYRRFNGATALMVTDKGQDTVVGRVLFQQLGIPVSAVRYVDLYLNKNSALQRLEQGEFDGPMLEAYHRQQQALYPGSELEPVGDVIKDVGTIEENGEGPYGRGDGRKLSRPPYWTDLQMYEWTYPLQNHGWRGPYPFKQMLDAYWTARSDRPGRLNPDLPAMRAFFTNYFEVEQMLNYIALENWCCPWDDTTQNHFMWQRRNGKWGMLPWDMDAWFGSGDNTPASASLFIGEVGDPNNNYRGPCFFKDGFIKAFRAELKERFFLLNNTLLHPNNLRALGLTTINTFAQARFTAVNQKCGLGVFQRPNQPTAVSPRDGQTALPPMSLRASAYTHSTNPAPAHVQTTWEIRAVNGTYDAPVWKLATATELTAVSLPFARLEFGRTYFWRCTYYDARLHPSVASQEASFTYGPASATRTLLALDAAQWWRYEQSGTDLSLTHWTDPGFDDLLWPAGPALLGEDSASLPEPIRTRLSLGRVTHYFRTSFDFPTDPRGVQLRFRTIVDDGCVVYLNGREAFRLRMDEGPVNYGTFANSNITEHIYEGPFDLPATHLVRGTNVIAVEVHQTGAASGDVLFGLSLEATIPAIAGDVVINEIAACNRGSVPHADATPDWLEVFNHSSQTVDLGGMSLTDDLFVPGRFVFPAGTLLAPLEALVVWCDHQANAPGLHTGFALDDRGQTVALFAPGPDGPSLKDVVRYGLQLEDLTIGRMPDGNGPWQLTAPTPGSPNRAEPVDSPAELKINEWMASASNGPDWFELYNPFTRPVPLGGLFLTADYANPTNTRIADLSYIGAQACLQFMADREPSAGADHVNFKLGIGGGRLGLYATNGTARLDGVQFGLQTPDVSEGRLPDGGPNRVFFTTTASPGKNNYLPLAEIAFSEVLAHSDPPLEDAIKLENLGASVLDLSGWYLSDRRRQPRKFRLPDPTRLPSHGFVVFYQNQFNADTNSPTSFALSSAHGETLVLSQADASDQLTGYRAEVTFGASQSGVSLGRWPTSEGVDFVSLERLGFGVDTPSTVEEFRAGQGRANSPPRVGPMVVSEILYQPRALGTNDNALAEFIELCNITPRPVPLYDPVAPTHTWRLKGGIDFDFPPGVVVPPGGCVVIVPFDPAADVEARAAFQGLYGNEAVVLGPYFGRLDNHGEELELLKPDDAVRPPDPEAGFVPQVLVERVRYRSAPPWPLGAAGTGASIQRVDPRAYGNEPLNWRAAAPSPGHADVPGLVLWRLVATPDLPHNTVRLQAAGPPGGTLTLQSSDDLRSWADVQTLPVVEGAVEFVAPLGLEPGATWFRARWSP